MAGVVFTTDPSKPLAPRVAKDGFASTPPRTVGDIFKTIVKNKPDADGLAWKENGEWNKMSYREYYDLCIRAAKSFVKLGVTKYSSIMITGFNSVEWFVANFGAIFAGGLSNGVYPTNSPEICQYIAIDSNAVIAVVENNAQLQKFLKIRDNLPNLKAIVQYKGNLEQQIPGVYTWVEFLKQGESVDTEAIEDIISSQTPEECCSLIYTSGTTGEPKGVMLSHDNLTFTVKTLVDSTPGVFEPDECTISYLPLSHIAGQMADIYLPMYVGSCLYFAQPDALKGSLGDTLREVKPHFFVGVPRVWEKFMAKIQQMLPPPGSGPPPTAELMREVSKKVLAGLGFTRCKAFITCAAPTDIQVFKFFAKFGIMLSEIWGMSEGTGPGTYMSVIGEDRYKLGTIGKPYLGVELRIDCPNKHTGDGEICFRGRTVMMGYINKFEKSREAIDDDGWMHSGDIGRIDEDGFLSITGRIKEIIITSGGENVAPVPIEAIIKKHAPFLSNVMLVGDQRKFLTCLVTIKCDMDMSTGCPLDSVSSEAVPMLGKIGCESTSITDIIQSKNKAVYEAITVALQKTNEAAVSNAQKVQKFVILKQDFSIPGGELGPTLKLKRFYVVQKYSEDIDSMYNI